MPTQRQLRVGEEIRHALATTFQRGDVPPLQGFDKTPLITVTEVQVSPDLRAASVFVVPLGGDRAPALAKALNAVAGFFRHTIAQNVKLRYVPTLRFKSDTSFDYAETIEKILNEPAVAKDLSHEEKTDLAAEAEEEEE